MTDKDRLFSGPAADPRAERLALLAEDCAEVVHAIAKVQRHGWNSDWHGRLPETNRQMLEREVGDLLASVDLLVCLTASGDHGDLRYHHVMHARAAKLRKLQSPDFVHCVENRERIARLILNETSTIGGPRRG